MQKTARPPRAEKFVMDESQRHRFPFGDAVRMHYRRNNYCPKGMNLGRFSRSSSTTSLSSGGRQTPDRPKLQPVRSTSSASTFLTPAGPTPSRSFSESDVKGGNEPSKAKRSKLSEAFEEASKDPAFEAFMIEQAEKFKSRAKEDRDKKDGTGASK